LWSKIPHLLIFNPVSNFITILKSQTNHKIFPVNILIFHKKELTHRFQNGILLAYANNIRMRFMPRPCKCRRIRGRPCADYFKPRGIPLSELEEVVLTLDEIEAMRLADLDGLYQEQAAQKMNISRQTFGNIVESARKKTANAIFNGKVLKIEGGVVKMTQRCFVCADCKNVWTVPYGTGRPNECPKCKSANIHRSAQDRGGWGIGRFGRGRGACRRTLS
jgi:predicted DNA-binding protein (UPF0251 family)